MNTKQKFCVATIVILLIISVLFAALNMFYFRANGHHFKNLADLVFDESVISCFVLKKNNPDISSIYKNIVVTSHVQQIVFIFVIFINYIIISISLICLHRTLKRQKI